MITKEFYTKLVGIYLQNKEKELVIGFSKQWKGINTILDEEDKLLIVDKDLNDIENNTIGVINILKGYEKTYFDKEIFVFSKNKYHKITDIHLDIDDCIVIDIEE